MIWYVYFEFRGRQMSCVLLQVWNFHFFNFLLTFLRNDRRPLLKSWRSARLPFCLKFLVIRVANESWKVPLTKEISITCALLEGSVRCALAVASVRAKLHLVWVAWWFCQAEENAFLKIFNLQNDIYNNKKILAIFNDLPGIQNNRCNPFVRLKSFINTFYVNV